MSRFNLGSISEEACSSAASILPLVYWLFMALHELYGGDVLGRQFWRRSKHEDSAFSGLKLFKFVTDLFSTIALTNKKCVVLLMLEKTVLGPRTSLLTSD